MEGGREDVTYLREPRDAVGVAPVQPVAQADLAVVNAGRTLRNTDGKLSRFQNFKIFKIFLQLKALRALKSLIENSYI